jgi:hypothetical protein
VDPHGWSVCKKFVSCLRWPHSNQAGVHPKKPRSASLMSTCTAVTGTGATCKKNACSRADNGLCALHHHMSTRAPDWTYHTGPPCIAKTAKGDPCKCSPTPGLDVCLRHSKKKAPNLDIPPECAICMNDMAPHERKRLNGCGHYFHTTCLFEWATHSRGTVMPHQKLKASCPMCRVPFVLSASLNV